MIDLWGLGLDHARPVEGLELTGGPLAAGATIGPYEVVGHLATGGMGEVYLARRSKGEVVVLKVMLGHLAHDEKNARMFIEEAKLASSLLHPNIVRVLDSGEDRRQLYYTMEYLTGHSVATCMKQVVKSGGRMPETIAARIVADAAQGLAYAHKAKGPEDELLELVHRDITPENIFVTYEGISKILDFGVAKVGGRADTTEEGQFKGKVPYMAPEAVRGEPVDARSDLFSLGVVFFELLTAKRLFGSDNPATTLHLLLNEPIPSIRSLLPEVDPELARICEFMLVREPDRRVQDADTVSEWLTTWLRARRVKAEAVASWLQGSFVDAHSASERLIDSLRKTGEIRLDDAIDLRLLGSGRVGDVAIPNLLREERLGPETAAKELGEVQPSFSASYYRSLTVDEQESVWDEDSASRVVRKRRWVRGGAAGAAVFLGLTAVGSIWLWPEAKPAVAPITPPEPEIQRPANLLGHYEVLRSLHEDLRGAIYEVKDQTTAERRLLRRHQAVDEQEAARLIEALRAGQRAAEDLALPMVLPLVEVGAEGAAVLAVHPWIEGRLLPARLAEAHEAAEVRQWVRELSSLFVATEQAGLVHGNLRPQDVVVREDGVVYASGFLMGAPRSVDLAPDPYRAPELDRGGSPERADQFALAALCQELLRTFDHDAYLRSARVIARAMAADPDKRFESVYAFARALDRELDAPRAKRRR